MDSGEPRPALWSRLGWDMADLILSRLPLRSIVAASAVCRQWRSVVSDPTFPRRAAAARRRPPWFFLYGQHNLQLHRNQAFAFDPDAAQWFPLSPSSTNDLFSGHGGFCFAVTPSPTRLSYSPLLRSGPSRLTPPLHSSRCNPLVAALPAANGGSAPLLIVAGGARLVGGIVDIEDPLAVEIYDPAVDRWDLGPPLPHQFSAGNSLQWLSSALLPTRRLLFVAGIYTGAVAAFDLARRAWSPVRILRPPGVLFAFLISGPGDQLVLAGLCTVGVGPARFTLWGVDHRTLEFEEIGVMPRELLACLFDADDGDDACRFGSLKCVGLDGRVYVFNEDHHKGYPACVCEIIAGGACRWTRMPPLPGRINQFHKVVAFCSAIPLESVLAGP